MTRNNGSVEPGMEDFAESDAFFDALALGDDPSAGTDPLAAALLDLKDDVDRPMPPAPQLAGAGEAAANVASLDAARAARPKRRVSPWLSGLIGAAAATVVCVGTGAALFDQGGSEQDTTVVELATTLDELEAANQSGDAEAARTLLEQARELVASMKGREQRADNGGEAATVTKTVTDTTTAADPHSSEEEPTQEQSPAVPDAPAAPVAPAPAQQSTQVPKESSQRGSGTSTGRPSQTTRATQGSAPTQPTTQSNTPTGNSASPSEQGTAHTEEARQQDTSPRVNDPATMVRSPAPEVAGGESGPVVHPGLGSS
ncbi:hypothetical protein [Corynebacterium fournieri]|uniref:hypothetical protein n=1 Tax=Corynebacterium fournieri TaxID=1852390 RepID=UPI0025B3F0C3|nr:hypothetical protein [Corynebacterium fournieri]WJY96847.1 hypothetical protein CFOUR_02045 [Corynebacterium fournieri]